MDRWTTARELQPFLKETGTSPRGEYFEFKFSSGKEIPVKILYDNGMLIECTCQNCSIHNNKNICVYKLGVIFHKFRLR